MGLDMYAFRRIKEEVEVESRPLDDLQVPSDMDHIERHIVITTTEDEDVMYWRKANHIHGWFVDNVQDGQDDCRTYKVDWKQLEELQKVCEEVITASKLVEGKVWAGKAYDKNHPKGIDQWQSGRVIENVSAAEHLLPTRDGFFFGSTQYDEQYLNDIIDTRDWAERMLEDHRRGVPGEIYYRSSW